MIEHNKNYRADFLYGNTLGFNVLGFFFFVEMEMDVVYSLISTGWTSKNTLNCFSTQQFVEKTVTWHQGKKKLPGLRLFTSHR